ncbi:MAG: response regulator, partial [Bacteroidetes bacterium]|nr:response regulator [Bacteroidota bacterium]
ESSGIEHDYFLVDNKDDFVHFLGSVNIDIIISDYSMPGYQGSEALKISRQHYAHIPFIFVSGTIGEDRAIEAMLNGATDYVLKNKLERLLPAIKRAMREYELEVKRKQIDVELKQKRELIKSQNIAIEKRSAELIIANEELAYQNVEKENRAKELIIANKELAFQNEVKEKKSAELIVANEELAFQNNEKEKRAAELIVANKELAYQNKEKEKRAAELVIANEELSFQTRVKEKRAAELIIANKELAYQNKEKEKRAAELIIANEELAYQNGVKEKRAAELIIANKELAYQNKEREKRAEELIIANKELAFQNGEKEKRAAELIVANKELAFQNGEKENRAKELIIANKELVFQNEEKEKRAAELVVAKEHAEESDRLKSAFLANMSHEIRTPMNGILGFAELLKQADLSGEEQQEYIKIIEKSGARMLNIINDIVNISRIEAGQMEVYLSKSNINEQIDFIYTFFKPEIEKKGIQFLVKKSLPAEEANITTDREKIFAILTNLVKNAIKFTTNGTIEFGYEIVSMGHDPLIQFYVKDTGMGIPKNRQEAIFERFIQADIADKMALQGAGLGLSITKAYVELLGGKIWVNSEKGKGSVFYFTIPFITKTQEKRNVETPTAGEIAGNQVKKLKILIVEDDPTSFKLISIATKKYCKELLKAATGIEAVEICHNNPDIDLILMDIQMPEMNGYEATRKIRKFNKDVIIIAQTAFVLSNDRKLILKSGCNDYISKPIFKDELVALVQKYFEKKALNK